MGTDGIKWGVTGAVVFNQQARRIWAEEMKAVICDGEDLPFKKELLARIGENH